jgi:hypothetical protein
MIYQEVPHPLECASLPSSQKFTKLIDQECAIALRVGFAVVSRDELAMIELTPWRTDGFSTSKFHMLRKHQMRYIQSILRCGTTRVHLLTCFV